jgi:very-short-patch-repair endonuclease
MTADAPNHRSRDVPWLNVVRFHKEVVARAEKSFFSMGASDDQAERWTGLLKFDPANMAGPWQLATAQLLSSPFRLTALQGQHESIFLGGPCYLAWEQSSAKEWIPQWRPLFYREVTLSALDDGLAITPAQGKWTLTPLLLSLVDRLEIKLPVSPDALVTELMEEASQKTGDRSTLAQQLLRALVRRVPGLADELSKPARSGTFRTLPTSWILFAPTGNFSSMTRHLMRDYERLESLLLSAEPDTGGLKLLEDRAFAEPLAPHADVSPFVQLNSPQMRAVEVILRGDPLTVISGPPGTGKSQVVVSLLLNAWAQGKTVLFASNNNKAVDVIRERIDRFESEFPIAVRAGSRAHQNVSEVLRRTLNMAGTAKRKSAATEGFSASKRRRLAEQRARLLQDLGSNVPQRIEEGRRAALQGYGERQTALAELADRAKALEDEQASLGLDGQSYREVLAKVADTQAWMGRTSHHKTMLQQDDRRRVELASEILKLEGQREATAAECGLAVDEAGDWTWLATGLSASVLSEWEQAFRVFITSPIDDALEPQEWTEEYDRWLSEEDAKNWALRARHFAEHLKRAGAELSPKLAHIAQLSARLSEERHDLIKFGIPENVKTPPELLRQWIACFAEIATREHRALDWLPWSRRAELERRLGAFESKLRENLPLNVLTEVGALNASGRAKLAPILNHALRWILVRQEWADAAGLVEEIEVWYREIRAEAAALRLRAAPGSRDPSDWSAALQECEVTSAMADRAAVAWSRRRQQYVAQERLRALARAGLRMGSGLPLREAWAKVIGAPFLSTLMELSRDPDLRTLVAARVALYAGSWTQLIDIWARAQDLHRRISELKSEDRQLPTVAARVRDWVLERPKTALVLESAVLTDWPDMMAANERLTLLNDWCGRAKAFDMKERPEKLDLARHTLDWAISKLQTAIEILPPTKEATKLQELAVKIAADREAPWPVAELTVAFSAFSPERLQAEVDRLTSLLERSAFEAAKTLWLSRLSRDDDAVRAVDALERSIRQHQGEVVEASYGLFRNVLRAIPIWITTAQAAQAIPLEPDLFDLVVIDEASQCTLTNLLPLVFRGKALAVIGDDNQLPAISTIQSTEELALANRFKIEDQIGLVGHSANDVYRTAAESLPRRRADVVQLTEHFRSHPQIIGFSNRYIYQQRLELKKDPSWGQRLPVGGGVHSVPVLGAAERGDRGRSWRNDAEADKVVDLIRMLRQGDARELSIGVVTPFSAQKELVRTKLDTVGLAGDVLVDTAYGFQGDERDVIVFSTVLAGGITPSAAKWVESPPNLVNVALTRAREALFVVADFDYCLQQEGILRKLALYCRDIQLLRDTSAAELELFSWMTVRGWIPKVHPRVGDLEVDFTLESKHGGRLVIEVDGRQHHELRQQEDAARDAFLSAKGFDVLRFPAREVLETPFEVLHRIGARLSADDRG